MTLTGPSAQIIKMLQQNADDYYLIAGKHLALTDDSRTAKKFAKYAALIADLSEDIKLQVLVRESKHLEIQKLSP